MIVTHTHKHTCINLDTNTNEQYTISFELNIPYIYYEQSSIIIYILELFISKTD